VVGRRFDATGAPLGSEFQVNTHTELPQDAPSVGVDAAGASIIVFGDELGYPNYAVVKGRRYDASGAPLGAEFKVSALAAPYSFGEHRPEIAVRADGQFIVTWSWDPPGAPQRVVMRRFDAAGVPTTGDIWMAFGSDFPRGFQAAITPSGDSIVAWTTMYNYYADGEARASRAQRFDVTGSFLPPFGFLVNTFTADDEIHPQIAVDASGRIVMVWEQDPAFGGVGQDGDGAGIFGQRYDATGAPVPAFVPISATRITLRDPGPTNRRGMGFRSDDTRAADGINLDINPTINGAFLHVFNSAGGGDWTCYPLPASGWTQAGSPDQPLYVYRDRDFVNGPCNVARIRPGKYVRANCFAKVQSIPYTLDEPAQGSVAAALTVGPVTYCADLGGRVLRDEPGIFKAKVAPAPGACASPPASCP
jgi:hypothetical protein